MHLGHDWNCCGDHHQSLAAMRGLHDGEGDCIESVRSIRSAAAPIGGDGRRYHGRCVFR